MYRTLAALVFCSPVVAAPVPTVKNADDPVPPSAAKLLKLRKVQKELKLTSEQRIALVDGLADIDEAIDKKREKLLKQPNLTADVFDKLEKEHQEQSAKFLSSAAAKVLSADLRNRLKQMDRQIRGPEAFTDPAVQKMLVLTDAQKKAIEKGRRDLDEKVQTYLGSLGNDDSDNAKEEVVKFRQEQMKSIVAGLTAEQRVLWTALLGDPVKGFDPADLWFTLIEEEDIVAP